MSESKRRLNAAERKKSLYVEKNEGIGRHKLSQNFDISLAQARYILENKSKISTVKIRKSDDKYIEFVERIIKMNSVCNYPTDSF